MAKSVPRIILSQIIGFIIFLILLAATNMLIPSINSIFYTQIILFFNSNIYLLLILTLIGILNEIFWSFYFPFNLVAPIISAVLSIYIITFIYKFWILANNYIESSIQIPLHAIYFAVFIIVLVFGYILLLARGGKPREDWQERHEKYKREKWEQRRKKYQKKIENLDKKVRSNLDWEDVEDEFKLALYNLGRIINNLFAPKKKKR